MSIDWFGRRRAARKAQIWDQIQDLQKKGDFQGILRYLDDAIQADPRFYWLHYRRGVALGQLGRYEEAKLCFLSAARFAPFVVTLKWDAGARLARWGQADAALPLLKAALWRWPLNSDVRAHLGAAYLQLRRFQKAEWNLNISLAGNPTNPFALYYMLQLYRATHRGDIIPSLLQSYIARAPNDWPGYFFMGEHYNFHTKQPQQAAEYYRLALERVGQLDANSLLREFERTFNFAEKIIGRYIEILADGGAVDEAKMVANEYLAQHPNHPGTLAALAYAFTEKSPAEAIACYEQALTTKDNPIWRTALALIYLSLERYTDAEREARIATETDPQNDDHWTTLASALANLSRFDEALDAADYAVSLAPNDVYNWIALCDVQMRMGQWNSALSSLRRVTALDGSDLWAWENLARANEKLGRLDDAAQAYHELLARDPADAEAWLELGKVRHQQGQAAEAKSAVERALEGKLTDDQRREAETLLANLGPGHQ